MKFIIGLILGFLMLPLPSVVSAKETPTNKEKATLCTQDHVAPLAYELSIDTGDFTFFGVDFESLIETQAQTICSDSVLTNSFSDFPFRRARDGLRVS